MAGAADRDMTRLLWVPAAAAVASLIGYAGATSPELFGIATAALLCVILIAVADRRPDLVIAGACFVVLIAGTKFRRRDPGASLDGSVDAQVLAELGLYVLLGLALAIVWLRQPLRGWRPTAAEGALLAYVGLALASTAWSAAPAFTAVRALQAGTLLALAVVAPAVLGARATMRALMRAIVLYVLVCAVLAAIFPWADGTIADYTGIERFSWFSIHPITAATYAALGALLLLAARLGEDASAARVLGLPWWLLVPALAAVIVLAASRGPLLAFSAAACALLLARFVPASGNALVAGFGIVLVLVVVTYGAAIDDLLSAGTRSTGPLARLLFRGQSIAELATLTGRIQLWNDAAGLIVAEPLVGHGYQASRALLLGLRQWAGYAHNALIQTALDLGSAGVALLFLPLCGALRAGLRAGPGGPGDGASARLAIFGVAVFLVLNAVTSESFAGAPGFEVLLLFSSVAMYARIARAGAHARSRVAVAAPAISAARYGVAGS
jgi:hypothetical protein